MNAKQRQSAKKREHIIEHARRLFVSDGFARTSLERLAREAGVSKMTIYRKFRNKEELFIETINDHCFDIYDTAAYEAASTLNEARHTLATFAVVFFNTVTAPNVFDLYRMLIGEMPAFSALGRLFYDSGPARTLIVIEHILSKVFDPDQAKVRANAFFHIVLGDAFQRYTFEKRGLIPFGQVG